MSHSYKLINLYRGRPNFTSVYFFFFFFRSIFWPARTSESTLTKTNKRSQHFGKSYPNIVSPTLAERSQHLNVTYRNIVGCNNLRKIVHPVATCRILKIELVRMPRHKIVARTWPNDYSITQLPQMLHEKFDLYFHDGSNNNQQVATCRNIAQRGQTRATCCAQQC